MNEEDKKLELIKTFGPAHVNYFVHIECFPKFWKKLDKTQVRFLRFVTPKWLIGRFSDIDVCDLCHVPLKKDDKGYAEINYIPDAAEMKILKKLEEADKTDHYIKFYKDNTMPGYQQMILYQFLDHF